MINFVAGRCLGISRTASATFKYLISSPLQQNFSRLTHVNDPKSYLHRIHSDKTAFLRQYTSSQQSNERKPSKQDYLTFKNNLDSIESVGVLVQFLQPLALSLDRLSLKQSRRVLKLLLTAERRMLESTGSELPVSTKKGILKSESISDRARALRYYSQETEKNREILLQKNDQTDTIKQFFALKKAFCDHQLKKMNHQQLLLGTFKGLTYLSVPTLLFFCPYLSLAFLHPYVGGTYYLFALLSLRQHQFMGIFISLLLAGSLSFAFFRTYTDLYATYKLHFPQ